MEEIGQEQYVENNPEYHKRSVVLTVVLILSFIGGGIYFFSYLTSGLLYDQMKLMLEEGNIPDQFLFMEDVMNTYLSPGKYYFFINAFFTAISVLGAVFMWQMRRLGFYLYSLAQIVLIILPLSFFGREGISIGEILLTILFVGFYGINFKRFV